MKPIWFKILRLGWSFACGLLCLFIVAVWIHSYYGSISMRKGVRRLYTARGEMNVSNSFFVSPESTKWKLEIGSPTPRYNWQDERNRPDEVDLGLGFRWQYYGIHAGNIYLNLTVHFCWLTALSAALATLSWLPWPRRFSLRTLLIVMTFVATVLGIVVTSP